MTTPQLDRSTLADLLDGRLPWTELKEILSSNKDKGRFDLYVEVLQSRVAFEEQILLPLGEHLYIVASGGGERLVKCDCGHEFGPMQENWKHRARVYVRDTEEKLEQIYDPWHRCDPAWMELREYYCPGCLALLELEAVPPGYPVLFDFRPDIDAFYEHFLGRSAPDKAE